MNKVKGQEGIMWMKGGIQKIKAKGSKRSFSSGSWLLNTGFRPSLFFWLLTAGFCILIFAPSSALALDTTPPVGSSDFQVLPQTGQVTSYAAGDDGNKKTGKAWPNPRFVDNNDGTITDSLTGLIWLKNANCFNTQMWADAISSANSLASGACGLTDGSTAGQWRLPNINELESLVALNNNSPALPAGHPFSNVQSGNYWSSSTFSDDTEYVWRVDMDDGFVFYGGFKTSYYYVWPIRGDTIILPKTGQTTSYVTGDDGDLRKGQAWPNPRFTDNSDGTITDSLTGLVWLKNANCLNTKIWTDALTASDTLASGSCGLSDGSSAGDWRLPNRKELLSLVDREKRHPVLPTGHPFSNGWLNYYWSSSTYSSSTVNAWGVSMDNGFVGFGDKTFMNNYVWPVRGPRQSGLAHTGILINSGKTLTNSTTVNIQFSATDDSGAVTQMKFSNDNSSWSAAEAYSVFKSYTLPSGDGDKTVYVKFGDAAGLWSDVYSDTITLDTIAPTIASATSTTANGYYKAGGAINITLNFSEAITSTGLTINLNSGGSITTGALSNVSSFSGTYTVGSGQTASDLSISSITGTITDAANNSTTNPAIPSGQNIGDSKAIVLDTTAPAVSAGANQTKNTQFTQTATATDTDSMTYQWLKQSGPGTITFGSATALSTTISASAEGTYTLRFTATDAAGNSAYGDMTLVWDTTPPAGSGYFYFLPKTGQTTSYGPRDDGALQMGLDYTDPVFTDNGSTVTDKVYGMTWNKNEYAGAVDVSLISIIITPNPRFTDNGNGTITDNLTGLIWLKNANCFGSQAWNSALSSANNLADGQCGLSDSSQALDWRLPNVIELASLMTNFTCPPDLWLNGQGFSNVKLYTYWSSSDRAGITNSAWYVNMYNGEVDANSRSYHSYVWPVRGGQYGLNNLGILINREAEIINSTTVYLSLSASDVSGITEMMLSNDGVFDTETVEAYSVSKLWTLSSGDGTKTVYVKFKDAAGNWSTVYSDSILLDTTPPVTGASPAGGPYTTTQTVTLSCSDGSGSGCKTIYYTTDGTTPTTGSSVYVSPLSIPSNTTLKFFSVDNAGNAEAVKTESYVDNVKPAVTISVPVDGRIDYRLYAISGTASDIGSGLSKVELQITDGVNYVASDLVSFSTTPIWLGATGTASWGFNSSSIKWEDNTTYTIKARSTDAAGNVSDIYSITFTKVPNYAFFTALSLDLSTQTMLQNATVTVTGKLTRYPDIGAGLAGLPIVLTITAPDGTNSIQTVATYDSLGHYILEDVSGFDQKGPYTIKADFDGSALLTASASETMTILVGSSAGYAVIIEGKIKGDNGLESHNKTANRIYKSLKDRGFIDDNIYYFNYDTTQEGVDAAPSKAAIEKTIETDIKQKMNGSPAPLYIIMVDHGNPNAFYIDNETITPADLNTWLDNLEEGLNDAALEEKKVIIIGSCYSGSFVPGLSKHGRVIITSAAEKEESYKGPNEPDGIRSGEFFLEELFKELNKGHSLKASFEEATKKTEVFTQKGSKSANSMGLFNDDAMQHPMLDDDGDKKCSNMLSDDDGDGKVSKDLYMGVGTTYDANSANNTADITEVTGTVYLNTNDTSASLWAKANYDSEVSSAWLELRKPSKTLSPKGGKSQLEVDIPRELMQLSNSTWSPIDSMTFDESGKYQIYYFVRDKETQEISPMKRSIVYKDKTGNRPPNTFNLISPANESEQESVLLLGWAGTVDPDGDRLTYTVMISTDSTFAVVDYIKDEIQDSTTQVGYEAKLKDSTTYYWKVLAVDTYGARRESTQVRSFKINNTNGLPGILSGSITDLATGSAIASATVTSSSGGTVKSLPNGKFFISLPAGPTTLTITAENYKEKMLELDVAPGATPNKNIKLVSDSDVTQYVLSVAKAGTGSGTVTSNPSGIDCDAGCSGTGSAYDKKTKITLTALAGDGAVFTGWSGGGCKGTNKCIVTLSKNINITANFTQNPTFKALKGGTGDGKIKGLPVETCGTEAGCTLKYRQKVTLRATPDLKSKFLGWSGECKGKGKCSITVSRDTTVTALFGKPVIAVSELSHSFGSLEIKTKTGTRASIIITNNGTADLKINKIAITGTDKAMFKLNGKAKAVIKPGGQYQIKITFKPTKAADKTATLTITSNDPGSPTVSVSLSGTGIAH